MTIWKSGRDTLHDGTILGALFGATIVWGASVSTYITGLIPETWKVLGTMSVPVYIIGAMALIGYAVDRV